MQTAFHLADLCPRLALARDQRVVEMVAENRMRVEVENMRHRLAWHASPARLQSAHFNQRGLPKRSFQTVQDAACFLAEHTDGGAYIVTGNKRERMAQYGNAVTPPAARELIARVLEVLS